MVNVSPNWIEAQKGYLAPEGFVELSYLLTEDGLQETAVPTTTAQAIISNIGNVTNIEDITNDTKFATFENNFWLLDGSMDLYSEPHTATGYVGENLNGTASITITLPEIHTKAIEGITIQWGEEYATLFKVTAYNGNSVVAEKTVVGFTEQVFMPIANYNKIVIDISAWNTPNRRVRIKKIILGIEMTITKTELISFKHTQEASHISAELPNNSITFSIDNADARWNPNNPTGMAKFLSERQKIKAKYGFKIDGNIEWVKAGTFYLTEWSTPTNGLEATFTARDLLAYMLNIDYTGTLSGTLYDICASAVSQVSLPQGAKVYIDETLKNYTVDVQTQRTYTVPEILQLCANASRSCMWQDRNGVLRIQPVEMLIKDYRITQFISYTHPEYDFMKELKAVKINDNYIYDVGRTGETQTVNNGFITDNEKVAEWIANNLKSRKKMSGEYRADPRIDVLDKIRVESKFGVSNAVILTKVEYDFKGAFKGKYEGYISSFDPKPAGYTGEFYSGELWFM